MLADLFLLAHCLAAFAYAGFAVAVLWRGSGSALARLMAFAALGTSLWAGSVLLLGRVPVAVLHLLETARDLGWFAVLLAMLRPLGAGRGVWHGLAAATVLVLALDAALQSGLVAGFSVMGVSVTMVTTRIAAAILGLVLVENLLRNLSRERLWAVKFLGIGLIFTLAAELLVRIPQFVVGEPDLQLLTVRPVVALLALPLMVVTAIRSPSFQLQVHSSRRIVLHLATLAVIGIVLQGTAIAAYYVRRYGGDDGTVLALVLSFASLIALAVLVASASFRSRLSLFIAENFFNYKYDYRLEWNRFIRAMSSWQDDGVRRRALGTLCDLLDSPGGILLLGSDGGRHFLPVARIGGVDDCAPVAGEDDLIRRLADDDLPYLDLGGADGADWRRLVPGAWLAIPLRDAGAPIAVALLLPPRAPRRLDWEDRNLIEIVALQLGAYLMQDETARALADARQLEAFNRRFAFIVHDVKNTIGQLSLLMRNVETFGHEPEFRKDMVLTVRESVARLQDLLARLKVGGDPATPDAVPAAAVPPDLATLIARFVEQKHRLGQDVVLSPLPQGLAITLTDPEALLTVLDHVLANAVEVSPPGRPVEIAFQMREGRPALVVADHGPGMAPDFIAEELFRPLRGTKSGGFGIGAFQAREVMRQQGGDIMVESTVGAGTRMVLLLPWPRTRQERMSA